MERAAIVLQARIGSRRLPGKVLAELGSRTLLEHCVYRLRGNRLPIIVATTELPEDDVIACAARRLNLEVFRGSEHDVLSRVLGAARAFDLTHIVRATGDNPLVDCDGPRRLLELVRRVQADHAIECGMPVGTAVEAVTVEALLRAQALIVDPYDREHVTSFVRRDARFRALRAVAPGDIRRPGLRLTVDTQDDLDFLRAVFVSLGVTHEAPRLPAIIRAADGLLVRAVASHRTQQGAQSAMRVLHLTTFLQAGAGRLIADLAVDQRRRGHDVMVVASSSATAGPGHSDASLETLGRNNVPVHLVDSMSARDYASNLCVLGAIDALFPAGREPNVIHTHAVIPSLVALLYAGVRRRPMSVLQTMHEWSPGKTPDQAAMDIALLNRVDRVVVPSRHSYELLESQGVLTERLMVVPYGVDDRQADLEPADEAVMLAMIRARRRGALVLTCVGTPGAPTNHPLLVEAIARLAGRLPIFCVFIGNSGTTGLPAAILDAGVETSVAVHPSSRAARRLSASADAMVLPSQGSGPPTAVLEAFCDGTMVAVGDEPELLELVADGETGLTFTSGDPDDLAAALLRLSTLSNQARREIRTCARSLYTGKFSTAIMAEQYQNLYQRLQQAPPRTRLKKRVA